MPDVPNALIAAGAFVLLVAVAILSSRLGAFYWIVIPIAGYKVAEWPGVLMGLALAGVVCACVALFHRLMRRRP